MANPADSLSRAFNNYARIYVLVTELISNPTQANIDTLLSTAEGAGLVRPKPTYSLDGESYNWESYQAQIIKIMADLRTMIIRLGGPFEVRSIVR
jgi:hypothetical protein